MKKFGQILLILVLIILIIAYFTKPGQEECMSRMSHDLTEQGYNVGLYISHSKGDSGTVHTPLTIKDRIFYRDVFYHFEGQNKKIAVAAFSHFFKIRF